MIRRITIGSCLLGTLALAAFVGCGAATRDVDIEEPADGAPTSLTPLQDGATFSFDGAAFADGGPVGHLRGTVRAPNGTVPVAGALVYLTKQKPEPTPPKVHCDSCVQLGRGSPHAIANERGEYDVAATELGTQYLVIQKGGFRRVREVYVKAGDEKLPDTLTTLPPKSDPATGDEVPRMTVVHGSYDEIEASLEKLGIDKSAFDVVKSPLVGEAARTFLRDPAAVNGRHIVFLPCGDYTQPSPNVDLSAEKLIADNLKSFVEAGGRLYVTDWHYDFVAKTFPGFVQFGGESAQPCSGCERVSYDAAAVVTDPGLASWMSAQGLSTFNIEKNYTGITGVTPVTTGGKTIVPRVWVSGSRNGAPPKPATISFEHGCGRVLFSTYHTEPFSTSLTPQERALLGVLLEVSVCNDSPSGVVIR